MNALRTTIALVALGAAASWLLAPQFRRADSRPGAGDRAQAGADDALARGAREYATIQMRPDLDDLEALRRTLAAMDIRDRETSANGAGDELLDNVAEFLHLRFGQPDPHAYIDWRTRRADRWRDWSELNDTWTIEQDWPYFVPGEPFPGHDDLSLPFARLFAPVLDFKKGANRPVAIAAEPKGLTTTVGVMTRGDPRREFVVGQMDQELWHGTMAATACAWWDPPHTVEQILARHGSVEYAEVGVILEFADGDRHPVIMTWTRDPDLNRWTLQYLNSYNTDSMKLSAWYY